MQKILFSSLFLTLVACIVQPEAPLQSPPSASSLSSESSKEVQQLEQVPSELSLTHFTEMRLQGDSLELTDILEENDAYTRYKIQYRSNGLLISGILNIPKGEGPFPLVILNHGYISPDVYTVGRGLKREQEYLAREGFAVLHTDYRGHGESDESPDTREVYDAGLEYAMDSINAINAMRAAGLSSVDATRVGMLGHSLGGGITLNVAVAHPEMIDAAVLYAPVHADAWENFVRWRDLREEGDRTRALLGTREDNPEAWDALSSLSMLEQIDDPVLLFHGTEDSDVPVAWSEFLSEELDVRGKDIEYIVYEGERHEFIPQWEDFMQRTVAFFREHLGQLRSPIVDAARITKKPFGILVTPEDSPVQPERFRGYHTGTDFEVWEGEDETDMQVSALCNGTVVRAGSVNGYGGVLVQSCMVDGQPVTVLYGHLSVDSLTVSLGSALRKGDVFARLGKGYSTETDNERPHLHLAVHAGETIELRGYVQTEEQLGAWFNPVDALLAPVE